MTEPLRTLWRETLRGGAQWSGVLRRGMSLKLTALEAGANLAALFHNYEQPLERYNMADTLKAQHTAMLTAGHVCYSDMGRILCSITADECGWHDPLGGLTDADAIATRYGHTRFQEQRNERYTNGRDAMLVELAKWGLSLRDLVANVKRVAVSIGMDRNDPDPHAPRRAQDAAGYRAAIGDQDLAEHQAVTCTRIGVGLYALQGLFSWGQFEMSTSTSISARICT